LNAEELPTFMQERIADRRPSVVVFASNFVPETVIDPDTSEAALFRRYLDAGRAVWLGGTPLAYLRDAQSGQVVAIDYSVAERITGIHYGGTDLRGMCGFYRAAPTPSGQLWGLTGWWVTRNAVDQGQVSQALALDEYGLAPLWYRRYGGPEGTGLVQLWVNRDAPGSLLSIIEAAEHGF
jgi:hypothetical protein